VIETIRREIPGLDGSGLGAPPSGDHEGVE
jgi:hypothetical protein